MSAAAISPARAEPRELERYLRVLAGPEPGGRLLEIRFALAERMGRAFIGAERPAAAGRLIERLAARTDVYVGAALRSRRAGGREAIERSHLCFIEIDRPGAGRGLARFAHPPTILIASGSPGHVHAYWLLRAPVSVLELERANRRLAHHLGGDLASVDAARILRPPGSLNHKHAPPAHVELLELDPGRRYELEQLAGGLPDPPGAPARNRRRAGREASNPLDRALLAIPAECYVHALAGIVPSRAGKIPCPFHELSVGRAVAAGVLPACSPADASLADRGGPPASTSHTASDPLRLVPPPVYFERLTGLRVGRSGKLRCLFHDDRSPSLHVYREPARGWYCFGCGRGGSIYDLAALLSGRGTRGRDFSELRRELEELFL